MPTTTELILAVDGGQTSTKALVASLDGTVLGAGRGGPSDHFHIEGGVEKNRIAIQGAIRAALTDAREDPSAVASVALGLTGAPTNGTATPIVHEIINEILSPQAIAVTPDYITNLAGGSGGQPGVVLIAGGGAISYGVTADGREALSGGFGYLLGDEGSAFDIGRRATIAAARASDGRDEPTVLQGIVERHFGIGTMREITRIVYAAGFSRDRLSLLAPEVASAAREGDAVAIRIMRTAGEELARTALATVRKLFEPGQPVDVFLTGGVFGAGDVLRGPFRATLTQGWPDATDRDPRFPPAVGGLIVARRQLGQEIDEAWLQTVERTLRHP